MLIPYFTKTGDREDAMRHIIDPFKRRWPIEVMLREAVQNSVGAEATEFQINVGLSTRCGSELFGRSVEAPDSECAEAILRRLTSAKALAYIEMRDNGTGLPDTRVDLDKNPWFIFTQTVGINYHAQGELAGGSKGKGRFSFALASEPRTFLIFTRFLDDDGHYRFNFQGFSVAEINHKGFGGEIFWGVSDSEKKKESKLYDSPEAGAMLASLEAFGITKGSLDNWHGTGIIIVDPWLSDEERKHWSPVATCSEILREMAQGCCHAPDAIKGSFKERAIKLLSSSCEWNFWNRLTDSSQFSISINCDERHITSDQLLNHALGVSVLGDYCSMWKSISESASSITLMPSIGKSSVVPLGPEERHDIKAMEIFPTFLEEWLTEADGGTNPLEGRAVVARFRQIANLVDFCLVDRLMISGIAGNTGSGVVLAIAYVDNVEKMLQEKLRDCENATHSEWDEDAFSAKANPVKRVMKAIRSAIREANQAAVSPIDAGFETRISPVISDLAKLMRLNRVGKQRADDGRGRGGEESAKRIDIIDLSIDRDSRKLHFSIGKSSTLMGDALDFIIKIASISKDEVAAEFERGEFHGSGFSILNGSFSLIHPGTTERVSVEIPENYLDYALTLEAKTRRTPQVSETKSAG
jgi:hypothetical protein